MHFSTGTEENLLAPNVVLFYSVCINDFLSFVLLLPQMLETLAVQIIVCSNPILH